MTRYQCYCGEEIAKPQEGAGGVVIDLVVLSITPILSHSGDVASARGRLYRGVVIGLMTPLMAVLAERIARGLEKHPNKIALMGCRLRRYIGKTVFSSLYGRTLRHKIIGTTFATLNEIMIEDETFYDFYKRKYAIELKYTDQEAIICEGEYYLPTEMCLS
jgi:hypothetical protein